MKTHNYFKNIAEENISQEFRLINIDETRNHLVEEIEQNELMSKKHKKDCTTEQNELMSKKHKKVCTTVNYIE